MLFRLNKVIETLEDLRDQLLTGVGSDSLPADQKDALESPEAFKEPSTGVEKFTEIQSKYFDEQSKQIAKLWEQSKKQKKMLKQVLVLLGGNDQNQKEE